MLTPATATAQAPLAPRPAENLEVAQLLERISSLLAAQQASPFRVRAYQEAAAQIRELREPLRHVLAERGYAGLDELPAIGPNIAAVIAEYLTTGHLRLLSRLEGRAAPEEVFTTLPGIGEGLAHRLHEQLGVETLEELERAAHDGRLEQVPGFGPRRTRALRDLLAARLHHWRGAAPSGGPAAIRAHAVQPEIATLLAVDAEYRAGAARGALHRIAPLRFNPLAEAWLPILHTEHDGWHFTVLFSNSALAHRRKMTQDWVVIYYARDGREGQCTVVTEWRGPLAHHRVVRGREQECALHHGSTAPHPRTAPWSAARDSLATVRALSTAAGHPGHEGAIETIETRLSWVFLTRCHAYKLKRPLRTEYFDYTSVEARHAAVEAELQLNRRLAASVYLQVVPVCRDEAGRHVEGSGEVVDWLLKMRRLSRDTMLDACIQRQAVGDRELDALAAVLSRFYAGAPRAGWTGPEYRRALSAQLASKCATLQLPRHDLDLRRVQALCAEAERWLEQHADLLDSRAPLVCEAHGDLRPEHVCLEPEPVIIDCLDFARELRLLDPLSELAFLDLECRRLQNDWLGPELELRYLRLSSDRHDDRLRAFYGLYHALIRAGLAAARLDEPGADLEKWRARANAYLELAAGARR